MGRSSAIWMLLRQWMAVLAAYALVLPAVVPASATTPTDPAGIICHGLSDGVSDPAERHGPHQDHAAICCIACPSGALPVLSASPATLDEPDRGSLPVILVAWLDFDRMAGEGRPQIPRAPPRRA